MLDGGFDKWRAEGRPTESGPARGYPPAALQGRAATGPVRRQGARCWARSASPSTVIVNALGPAVPQGPRAQPLRPAGARCRAASMSRRRRWSIRPARTSPRWPTPQAKFAAKGVTPDKRVICYCGGGISATIDLFLLHQLGYDDLTLYDGSMGEWARDECGAD